ncbi:hypothetical protein [Paraburkholderia kirstenboschensis]|uniref:Uncharacterized protein n=1 Tax=Paraburkholderia kirstenboschensis TaxID=1245436 RepID=A0ABZ0ECA4_9BURK|nr:hypothetical protein [Paraburkholderia kirstenboschensis]WOD13838.1 hypothetical protein RW095_07835 [Paraburkholderia kirstenboschensis]
MFDVWAILNVPAYAALLVKASFSVNRYYRASTRCSQIAEMGMRATPSVS